MATIRKEITVRANPALVWDAIRDVGAIHTRLAPDCVTNVIMAGDARIVTFANGMVAKELIVTIDDEALGLVWSVVEGRPRHHNGAIQVFPEGLASRLIWIADILPSELAGPIGAMMQAGMDAMKTKLEADSSARAA